MKPFEVGKTYKDGNGRDVRIICTDRKCARGFVLVGLREDIDGETLWVYTKEGEFTSGGKGLEQSNLIPENATRTVWLNVYPPGEGYDVAATKEVADRAALRTRLACIPVTIELP